MRYNRNTRKPIRPGDSIKDIDGIKTEEVSEESFKPELLFEELVSKDIRRLPSESKVNYFVELDITPDIKRRKREKKKS